MKLKTSEMVSVVHRIQCDRCGIEAERGDMAFEEITSIDYVGGYGSTFGDGNKVEIDLCDNCLKDTLGRWLRVTAPN